MKTSEYRKIAEDIKWAPHPSGIDGVQMKILRSAENGKYNESIAIVKVEKGASVPPHVHQEEDDNLYILKGTAVMKVQDEILELTEGVQVTVPAGILHEIFNVAEELLIYDVFAPGTF